MSPLVKPEMSSVSRSEAEPPTSSGFVVLSRFVIANGMAAAVKAAFCNRPHLVDDAPGYRRMEVISPLERPEEIWLLTFWTDEASIRAWKNHAEHRIAQETGMQSWYQHYETRVAKVERAYSLK